MSGTQIIRATIQDELARSRQRRWGLVIAFGLAIAVGWVLPRLDQTAWSIQPLVLLPAMLGGAVGAAHRQRMFGRRPVSQVTSAALAVAAAAAVLALVVLVNRLVAAAPGSSPLEHGLRWVVDQGISPFAPAVALIVVFLAWVPGVVRSERRERAEAAAWRASHGPDGFTPTG